MSISLFVLDVYIKTTKFVQMLENDHLVKSLPIKVWSCSRCLNGSCETPSPPPPPPLNQVRRGVNQNNLITTACVEHRAL